MFLAISAAFVAAAYLALKLFPRAVPAVAAKLWFGCTFAISLVVMWLWASVAHHFLPLLGVHKLKTWHRVVAGLLVVYKALIILNPQITIEGDAELDALVRRYDTDPQLKHSVLGFNHTSFFDSFALFSVGRLGLVSRVRMVYKSDLISTPLWGTVLAHSRSFPVFFKKSDEGGNFSVDREKQDPVNKEMHRFLTATDDPEFSDGTCLSLYPEGAINRGDPTVIQSVRHGTIKMIMEAEASGATVPLVLIVQHGAWLSWPPGAAIGGLPCKIFLTGKMLRLNKGSSVEENAEMVRAEMQAMMDRLKARAAEEKKTQ